MRALIRYDKVNNLISIRVGRCRLITEKALREWLERKTEAALLETNG
jgi:hypothetical protein